MSSTEGKVINCRAGVLWKVGSPLVVENITVDPPKCGEARIKMVAAGLCATDAHLIWGQDTDVSIDFGGIPVALGHEGAGIVESVGPGVSSVAPGDKVICLWMPQCNKCQLCANPKTNFCMSDNFFTTLYHPNKETRLKIDGNPLLALSGTSTYSEYAVIRETQLAKISPNSDLKKVCIIGCAVGTGIGSVRNLAKVHPGAKCAVWGLGAIGLSTLLGCKEAGAKDIIGIDINPEKEVIGRQFGCTEFINPNKLGESVENYFQKQGGLDYAFDCIGNQTVLDTAYNCLCPWGSLIVIGLGPKGNSVTAKVVDLLTGRQVLGGYFGNLKPREFNQQLVERHISGDLPIDALITERISLDEINDGFDRLKAGKTVRTIIEF